MKIIISPAKSLNFEKVLPTTQFSHPILLKESKKVHQALIQKTPLELAELMSISRKLAEINWQRNIKWKTPFNTKNARPAIYTFDGEVYKGLDPFSIPIEKLDLLQDRLRILSGLYGVLKPLDLIQAYRLEMGTKLAIGENPNLYLFWKDKITQILNKEIEENELFINLASNEYASVIDKENLKTAIITPEFREHKNGKTQIISFFAKKARGLMTRYVIDNQPITIEDIKEFNLEKYRFNEDLSTKTNLVFTR